jgi:hypothetical protein
MGLVCHVVSETICNTSFSFFETRSHYVVRSGLEIVNPPAFVSLALGLQVCMHN